MSDTVNIAILLREARRNPESAAQTEKIASDLGIEITGAGNASLSGKVPAETFARIFGIPAEETAPELPTERDFGAPGGHFSAEELSTPAELEEFVENIAIVPPARRLSRHYF
ncbi:MAG TPA: hypothetical protein VGB02_15530 [Pyrinomonadaceae bacterium]|jgi:hypothetical protein